jgi:hypothetical protein
VKSTSWIVIFKISGFEKLASLEDVLGDIFELFAGGASDDVDADF